MESLPENVIDEILRRLPTKSAARTAVLSRSWRHRWRSIPDLDLTGLPDPLISRLLHLHSGPIRLFKARSDDDSASLRWFSALSHRASSTLISLDLSDFARSLHLHSIAADFPILAHLRLSFCSLLPDFNPSNQFRFLQTLHLENVRFPSVSGRLRLSTLIPSCPSLESLTLILFEGDLCCDLFSCEFPRLAHLKLSYCDLEFQPLDLSVKLTALRTLHLDSAEFYGQISGLFSACPAMERLTLMYVGSDGEQWIDIVAFNLRWIKFVEVMNLKGFVITSAPVLEMAILDCRVCGNGGGGGDGSDCNLMKLLEGADHIKELKLGNGIFEFLRSGNIPERLPMSFHLLRFMSLGVDFGDVKDLIVVFCLLRSTPNLQELKFKGSFYNREVLGDGRDFWEAQEDVSLFDNLETLKMIEIMGVEAELDFIQFVLAKAKVLHKLMISFHGYIRNKELVMEKLLELSTVSNQVQVIII